MNTPHQGGLWTKTELQKPSFISSASKVLQSKQRNQANFTKGELNNYFLNLLKIVFNEIKFKIRRNIKD
jgi:hypothetical protein